jgi:hypothetical protein
VRHGSIWVERGCAAILTDDGKLRWRLDGNRRGGRVSDGWSRRGRHLGRGERGGEVELEREEDEDEKGEQGGGRCHFKVLGGAGQGGKREGGGYGHARVQKG